jgi:ferredoxin/flavodoxin---NADP+ reductase
MTIGSLGTPFRVAIIGSGPSGFYAAERLQKEKDLTVHIDMFDRLPTPFGLVRGGVAPDHQKIKSVTKVYDRIASKPNFHFYGNVEFGRDVTHADLAAHYHAIIYAVGAQTDRNLSIPGEDLSGSHAATEFVGWYNGHPDYRHHEFDLSQEAAAIIGVGNVAMDVARILGRNQDELSETDITDYALAALAQSNLKTIYVFGRRGPAQAAFTNPEIKELGELGGADLIIDPKELDLDPLSEAYLNSDDADKKDVKNVTIMRDLAGKTPVGKPRQVVLRFLASPVEIIGTDHVQAVKVVKNELYKNERGTIRPRATEETEVIPVGLVFRSVGYRGVALPDVPFYEKWGIIPNREGRVLTEHETGERVIGDYVVGWIKRGPSGIIGTNKPDAVETVEHLLADAAAGVLQQPTASEPIHKLLSAREVDYVTYDDWLLLDRIEQQRGEDQGRPRLKFSSIEDMLAALRVARQADPAGD